MLLKSDCQELLEYLTPAERRELELLLSQYEVFKMTYWADPVGFVRDCIEWDGEEPTEYQIEILEGLWQHKRACVRALHGAGKTTLAAWVILWWALTRDGKDWKAITTAGAWSQVILYLWPEVHKWAGRLRWRVIGRPPFAIGEELLQRNLKLSTGAASSVVSSDSALIEGAHADHLLYIYDESKSVSAETFDAAEGAFASGKGQEALALAISTPGEPSGRFYDIQARHPGYEDWWVYHISFEQALRAGRVTEEWRAQRAKQWGADTALYLNRVMGEFAPETAGALIPLAWIEAANDRWLQWEAQGFPGTLTALGVDVGSSTEVGDHRDEAAVAAVYDHTKVRRVHREAVSDPNVSTLDIEQYVVGLLGNSKAACYVDTIGVGLGVGQHLRARGCNMRDFVAGWKTNLRDSSGEVGFSNWRSAGWVLLRELLDPANEIPVCLPPDDKLTGDLCAVRSEVPLVQHVVEGKDEIRKRLGRSTDSGDAVMMALAGPILWRERVYGLERRTVTYEPVRVRR